MEHSPSPAGMISSYANKRNVEGQEGEASFPGAGMSLPFLFLKFLSSQPEGHAAGFTCSKVQ